MRTPEVGTRPGTTRPNAKAGDLAAELIQDAQLLVSLEVALAKQEIKDLAMANAVVAGLVAFGGLLAVLALLVAAPMLVVVAVPWHWQAAVVWLAATLVLGIGLYLVGRSRFRFRLPDKTLNSLKENKEWALRQMRSTAR